MIRIVKYVILLLILFQSLDVYCQDSNLVVLHMKVYDEGVCTPLIKSNFYSTSRYQKAKSVLVSGSYYSTIYVYVNSIDSGDIQPLTNHELQSSSLRFNPELDYDLVFLRYDGFNQNTPDSMVVKISKLDKDAQVILPFEKGTFKLNEIDHFKKLKIDESPEFINKETEAFKITLKLDSISYFSNGQTKAKYYFVSENFTLFYVQEFDSIHPNSYAQGYHMMSNYLSPDVLSNQTLWSQSQSSKYGYWEYFQNGVRIKHEYWASMCLDRYEWYPSGQLKYESHFGDANQKVRHTFYLESGKIKETFEPQSTKTNASIKSFNYSPKGDLSMIVTYKSSNGITKQGLLKREVFYASGKLKMEESYLGTYTIKYYNEDGKERTN